MIELRIKNRSERDTMLYRLSYEASPEAGHVRVQCIPLYGDSFFWALFETA